MTGEFSRRSFLKYTALTAVAVAGSSLLTGCGGDAPVQRAVGTSNRVLKVVSTLEQVECDAETNTTLFKLVVTNGRNNALEVTKANFAVKAEGYLAYQNDKLQVTSPDALSHQVKKGETVTYYVTAKGLNALTDGPVTFTFYPDLQYSEFSANWELTADVLKPEESGPPRPDPFSQEHTGKKRRNKLCLIHFPAAHS